MSNHLRHNLLHKELRSYSPQLFLFLFWQQDLSTRASEDFAPSTLQRRRYSRPLPFQAWLSHRQGLLLFLCLTFSRSSVDSGAFLFLSLPLLRTLDSGDSTRRTETPQLGKTMYLSRSVSFVFMIQHGPRQSLPPHPLMLAIADHSSWFLSLPKRPPGRPSLSCRCRIIPNTTTTTPGCRCVRGVRV